MTALNKIISTMHGLVLHIYTQYVTIKLYIVKNILCIEQKIFFISKKYFTEFSYSFSLGYVFK